MGTVRSRLSALSAVGGVLFILLVAALVYALVTPSGYYLLIPDAPNELAPLVKVEGGHERGKGRVYFVDVVTRQATLAERYLPFLRSDSQLISKQEFIPDGISDRLRKRLDAAAMERSKDVAATVALRSLGYKVSIRPGGVMIAEIAQRAPARSKLEPGDVLVAIDGKPSLTSKRVQELVDLHKPGDELTLTVERDKQTKRFRVATYADPGRPGETLIGIFMTPLAVVDLPLDVEIDSQGVVGPSAGLAFALQIVDELGRDVDRGRRIAATGELTIEGKVEPIGAVEQKVIGARRAGVQIMLVPAGDNAREARRFAGDMKIIAVSSFQQALHALTTRAGE